MSGVAPMVADPPILYSFRRCPYAMRARMALWASGVTVALREVALRDKPEALRAVSPKATVPVLVTQDGVIEESREIMDWALARNDPEGWRPMGEADRRLTDDLIARNDGPFKHHLDRYKYASRYDGEDAETHRATGSQILSGLDARIAGAGGQVLGPRTTLADIALFPFVRQFRIADPDWFDAQDWPALHTWLTGHMGSQLFAAVMKKTDPWIPGDAQVRFGRNGP